MAFQRGRQAFAHGLYFGQFGHIFEDVNNATITIVYFSSRYSVFCALMKTVPFGFRDVAPEDKPALIRGIFSSVASRYDLMNDLMSGGVHRLWKDDFVAWLNPQPNDAILDVAGGTGDIAFRISARVRAKGGVANITVCDFNEAMLGAGMRRPEAKAVKLNWVCGDGENLPVE